MTLTESQFRTSNVSNLDNRGNKWKGITASDKKGQSSTINVSNSLKQKLGIDSEPLHISRSSDLLLLRSSRDILYKRRNKI